MKRRLFISGLFVALLALAALGLFLRTSEWSRSRSRRPSRSCRASASPPRCSAWRAAPP